MLTEPDKRFHFSMVRYKQGFIIFGGASNYLSMIKQRETFNDIWIYSEDLDMVNQSSWS